MNTTLKVGDRVKVKGTRSFNPRFRSFSGSTVRECFRHYVERIEENTCHAETQTICYLKAVHADCAVAPNLLAVPAFMLEPDSPFDWTEYDADIERTKKQDDEDERRRTAG